MDGQRSQITSSRAPVGALRRSSGQLPKVRPNKVKFSINVEGNLMVMRHHFQACLGKNLGDGKAYRKEEVSSEKSIYMTQDKGQGALLQRPRITR